MGNFQQKPTSAAFEVKIREEKPCSPPPKRFNQDYRRPPLTSVEVLKKKQQVAQERREKFLTEKLEKARPKRADQVKAAKEKKKEEIKEKQMRALSRAAERRAKLQAEKLERIRPKRLDLAKDKRNAGKTLQDKLRKAQERRERLQEEKLNRLRSKRGENAKTMTEYKRTRSAQRLQEKQQKALERREKFRAEKLDKIQKNSEECQKMAESLRVLAQQDAKRRGIKGTENVPTLTRKQAVQMIEQVATGFKNLNSEFDNELSNAKK